MRIVNQRADLRFIIEQLDIDDINQSTARRFAVEREVGIVAELGLAAFFLAAEGEQQRQGFQRTTDFRQRGHHLGHLSDLRKVINAPFDDIGAGVDQAVGVTQYFIQRFADQRYTN